MRGKNFILVAKKIVVEGKNMINVSG